MAHYDIRPLQLRLCDNLATIHQVFQQHNLRYYLSFGTMLGAMRHKGFIPWDDDVDISMPRPDYERLLTHAKEWLPPHLEMIAAELDPDYPFAFGKIQDARTTVIEKTYRDGANGIYIDIFPIDGAPSGKLAQWLHYRHHRLLRKLLYFAYRDPYKHGHGIRSWMPLLLQKMFTRKWTQSRIRHFLMSRDYETSAYVSEHDTGRNIFLPREYFGTPRLYPFENTTLMGVEQPDAYLTHLYGTWQQLPPENKRHQHQFHFLDLDTPYREHQTKKK